MRPARAPGALAAALALSGCYDPDLRGGYHCRRSDLCPRGMMCCADQVCRPSCGDAGVEGESESESESEPEPPGPCGDGVCALVIESHAPDPRMLPVAVPDDDSAYSDLEVPPRASPEPVASLTLTIDLVQHPAVGTLRLILFAPGGRRVVLRDALRDAGADMVATRFVQDEAAPLIARAAAPFTGDFRPQDTGAWRDVASADPAGTWSLRIDDTVPDGIGGSLAAWHIEIATQETTASCPADCPAEPAPDAGAGGP